MIASSGEAVDAVTLSMEGCPMFVNRWCPIATVFCAMASLCLVLLPDTTQVSERLLTRCRGKNPEVHSLNCVSCAGLNLVGADVDECLCPQNQGAICDFCEGDIGLSQNLAQGHTQGDPGWLSGNYYLCDHAQEHDGRCQADGTCGGITGNIGFCDGSLTEQNPET